MPHGSPDLDQCSHGKAMFGIGAEPCVDCDVVWHREGLLTALENVERHKRALSGLGKAGRAALAAIEETAKP